MNANKIADDFHHNPNIDSKTVRCYTSINCKVVQSDFEHKKQGGTLC